MSILLANIIFWPMYIVVCNVPYIITQAIIDNHETLFRKYT